MLSSTESPQDQIQAFRSFHISPQLQQMYEYPPLKDQVKANMLCGNAAHIHTIDLDVFASERRRDAMGQKKELNAQSPNLSFRTYGPSFSRKGVAGERKW